MVLAQVEQVKLTLDDVRESFPPEYEKVLSREQYLDFIQRWIDDEVVYQQALKSKLDQDPKVARKLDRLRHKVLIEEFLSHASANQDFEPDEGAMTRYYEMHKEEFRRKSPEFRYAHIRVNTLKEALALRSRIRGDNFTSLAEENAPKSGGENAAAPFRKTSEIPTCLLHDLNDAKPGWQSTPISCPDGVYLIKLLERYEAGTPIPFSEAKEAISAQLLMEQKDKMLDAKIRQYRENASTIVNLDQIPGQEGGSERTGDDSSASSGETTHAH